MILIVVEQTDGTLKKSAFELVTAAAALAPSFQDSTAGLVLGPGSTAAANALADYLPEVVHLDAPELSSMPAEAVTTAVVEVARLHGAEVVLFAATRAGLSVSPRVAARMDVPLLEDVLDLEVHDGLVVARRFSYLSRITETVQANSRPIVVSVKPGTFQAAEPAQPGTVEAASVVFSTEDTRVTVGEKTVAATGRVSLVEARVVVTGGRGVGSTDGFEQLVEPLADALNAGHRCDPSGGRKRVAPVRRTDRADREDGGPGPLSGSRCIWSRPTPFGYEPVEDRCGGKQRP